MRRQIFFHGFNIGAQRIDVSSPLRAQLPFERPASERQQAGLNPLRRLLWIVTLTQIAYEDVHPQIHLLNGHGLQLQAAAGTEIVVGNELVG